MGGCQLDHWARTGEFVPREHGDKSYAAPSPTTEPDDEILPQQEQQHSAGLDDTAALRFYLPGELVGEEDDVLIPRAAAIDRTFYDARETWRRFLHEAEALPPDTFPDSLANPYILLKDVPALPRRLPAVRTLTGQPIWHLPDPEAPAPAPAAAAAATTAGPNKPLGRSGSVAAHARRLSRTDSVPQPKKPLARANSTASHSIDRRKSGASPLKPTRYSLNQAATTAVQQRNVSGTKEAPKEEDTFDMQDTFGMQKELVLQCPDPIECCVSPAAAAPPLVSSGHLILTLCWSYILSVRLLEIQRRPAVYSAEALQPINTKAAPHYRQEGHVVLNLSGHGVSPALVRWMCALLSPTLGWFANDNDGVPPWTTICGGDVMFAVAVDDADNIEETTPPTSAQAAKLLAEFCTLFGLDTATPATPSATGPTTATQMRRDGIANSSQMTPPTAAFIAALGLPFYRAHKLQPLFPVPKLRRRNNKFGSAINTQHSPVFARIRQYTTDLNYFMTLSNDPRTIGSILFSIFWQPDVECNVVSPWLAGISDVLRPLMESRDLAKLVKVFAVRRPRVAIWWLALYLLGANTVSAAAIDSNVFGNVFGNSVGPGNEDVVDWIARYLETLEERYGYGTMATPSLTANAWTGVRHGYTDAPPPPAISAGASPDEPVSRADLLWHRYNFRLRDDVLSPTAWKPFGQVSKEEIEPDIWPWLEHGCRRQYVAWVWWIPSTGPGSIGGIGGGQRVVRHEERGFRRDTGRFVARVPDRLEMLPAGSVTASGLTVPNGRNTSGGRRTPNGGGQASPSGRGTPNGRRTPTTPKRLSVPRLPPGSGQASPTRRSPTRPSRLSHPNVRTAHSRSPRESLIADENLSRTPTPGRVCVRLEPSRSATLRMVHFCMEDMTGDIDTSLAILNGIRGHQWLMHEKGFG